MGGDGVPSGVAALDVLPAARRSPFRAGLFARRQPERQELVFSGLGLLLLLREAAGGGLKERAFYFCFFCFVLWR